jgi:SRSO17 transposase
MLPSLRQGRAQRPGSLVRLKSERRRPGQRHVLETARRGHRAPARGRARGSLKYALSNLPPDTTLQQAVGLWRERWQVERGYEQLKGELGLDHFEGRSWPGFHHHAAMTFLAYGFLALERQRAQATAGPPGPEAPPAGEAGRGA